MPSSAGYTLPEVARILGKHYQTIWNWHNEGRINSVKIGNMYVVSQEEVNRLKQEQKYRKDSEEAREEVKTRQEINRAQRKTQFRGL